MPPGKPKGHSVHHVVSLLFVKYTKKRKWSQEKARKKKKKKHCPGEAGWSLLEQKAEAEDDEEMGDFTDDMS